MKMRNVGPKKITKSLLEGRDEPTKKKRLKKLSDTSSKGDLSYRVLSRKDPDELTLDERKELKRKRKERKKKREHEEMQKAEANDRRVSKEEALKKKEKKLSKSRELIVSVGVGNLSPKEQRQLEKQAKSYFGSNSSKITEMLENGDADSGITVLKKTLLLTIIRVLPMAEEILNSTGTAKGTYQFVTLISQMRELMADIQQDKDKQFLAQTINEQIIRPAFMNIAQEMLTQHHEFRKKGDLFIQTSKSGYFNEQLMNLGKGLASKMNDEYKDVSAKMAEALKN